jgi:hypothetical protein
MKTMWDFTGIVHKPLFPGDTTKHPVSLQCLPHIHYRILQLGMEYMLRQRAGDSEKGKKGRL